MPRKRQIDPSIWVSEQFAKLTELGARLLFIGMISHADDEGRLKGNSLYLKMAIFPGDEVVLETIKAWRDQIASQGLIQIYTNDDNEYIYLPTFQRHQYITKRLPSRLPPPPENIKSINSATIPQPVNNHSITAPQPVNNQLHDNGIGIGIGNGNGVVNDQLRTGNGEVTTTTTAMENTKFAKICQIYESNIGILTPMIGQELQSIADLYSSEWFSDAVKIACEANVRKLSYIRAILERWQTEGKNSLPPKEKQYAKTGRRPRPGSPNYKYEDPD